MQSRKQTSHKIDMLNGPLLKKILLFALPLAASSILQQLFNSADVAVVGRFTGSHAMAAVGSSVPVINLLIMLFVGLSVGSNVVIAQFIGLGQKDKAQEATHTSILLALISGILLMIVGVAIARPIMQLIDTPVEILDQAVLYLRIYFLGMPFFMLYNFGSAVLRSVGDTRRPLYCLFLSGVINVLLNLFFVIVCHMGVAGVAIATSVSNAVSAGFVIWFLLHEEDSIRLHPKRLRLYRCHLREIIRIGAPSGLQGVVFSLSNVCIQAGINSFGPDAIAGSTAALNFEYFSYFMVTGFVQAATTFTSQNYAAGLFDRCKKVFRQCMLLGVLSSLLLAVILSVWKKLFASFYTVEPTVLEYVYFRMNTILLMECMTCSYEISGAALRGMGRSLLPALITMAGTCGLRFAWVYLLFPRFGTYSFLLFVYPATWVITGAAVLIAYFTIRKRLFSVRPDLPVEV